MLPFSVSELQIPGACYWNGHPPVTLVPVLRASDPLCGHPAHLSFPARCGHMATSTPGT